MPLRAKLRVTLEVVQTSSVAADIANGVPQHPVRFDLLREFTSGIGDKQLDAIYCKRLSVTAGAPLDVDLKGSLIDGIGGSAAFIEGRVLLVVNRSTTGTLLIGGDGTAPTYSGLFSAANDVLRVGPGTAADEGGLFLWVAPKDAKGLTVTATTADILQVDADTGTVEFDILVLGVSA